MEETIFSPAIYSTGSLVIIQKNDGTKIEGVVLENLGDSLRLGSKTRTPIGEVTKKTLSEISYIYVGFPLNHTESEAPVQLRTNGTLEESYSLLLVNDGKNKWSVRNKSNVLPSNDSLKNLTCKDVIFVKSSQKDITCAYVLPKETLDETLDKIVEIANSGDLHLAKQFCKVLSGLFPEENYDDIRAMLAELEEFTNVPQLSGNIVQHVEASPEKKDGYLSARGQILNYYPNSGNGGKGNIVDLESHQLLFFDTVDLQDNLGTLEKRNLIGKFVTYTIIKGLHAKSVLPLMSIKKACDLADDLYEQKKQRTACDILRIVLKEKYDDYVHDVYDEWKHKEEKAGRYLWEEIELPKYQAPPLHKLSQRNKNHTEMISLADIPDSPFIGFGDSFVEQTDVIPGISETLVKSILNDNDNIKPEWQEEPKNDSMSMIHDINENIIDITDEDINSSYASDEVITSNSTLTFRYYIGGTIRFNDSNSDLFVCTIDDIIDDELRQEAINSKGTEYIREIPVICQKQDDGKASSICRPDSVGNILIKARDLYTEAMEANDEDEDSNSLLLLRMAQGYISHVESSYPQNHIASDICRHIRKAIKVLSSHCYKSSAGSLRYTGYVANNKTGNRRLEDMRFEGSQMPRFTLDDIVDPDYAAMGVHAGDELMYAVYLEDTKKHPNRARFVHRALSEEQLVLLIKDWESKGNILNAWGIARNLQDACPESEVAGQLIEKYEQMQTADGELIISEEEKAHRQQPITESVFKQARQAFEKGDERQAINLYKLALVDYKTDKQSKAQSVSDAIVLFSKLYQKHPEDNQLYQEYKDFGISHLVGDADFDTFVRSVSKMRLGTARVKLIYYLDMKEYDHLIDEYDNVISLINDEMHNNIKADADALSTEVAEAWAWKAWIQLRRDTKGYSDASRFAKSADKLQPNIEKAILSSAVCEWREKKGRSFTSKIVFSPHEITRFNEWLSSNKVPPIYNSGSKMHNLIKERFALLCRIVKSPDNSVQYLARYIGTLLFNEKEYYKDVKANSDILPNDCWVAQQLYSCIKMGINWPGWMDIRLLVMLEVHTAHFICDLIYNLDCTFARDLVVLWDRDFKHASIEKLAFARHFNVWRGQNFQARYASFLSSVEEQITHEEIISYVDFIRGLERKDWMVQEDGDLISTLKQQLPDLLTEFAKADRSRTIIMARRGIIRQLDELCDANSLNKGQNRIHRRPTVLSITALVPLLDRIRVVMENDFNKRRFTMPKPMVNVLSVSALGEDGSMTIELEIKNNAPFAYAMKDCELVLPNNSSAQCVTFSDTSHVYGEESLYYIISFKINTEQLSEEQGLICPVFSYRVNDEDVISLPLSIEFCIKSSFNEIPDPYGDFKNIAVNNFYGRDNFISDIIEIIDVPEEMPHYFFYGQKRSGKSSVLYHIKEQLQKKKTYLCVEMSFATCAVTREEDVYFEMLSAAISSFNNINSDLEWEGVDEKLPDVLMQIPSKSEVTYYSFISYFQNAQKALHYSDYWKNHKIVFFIDEFTSVYRWMKGPNAPITELFMQRWKEIQNKRLFCAILVGQDILASFIEKAGVPNAFGVLNRRPLNYLEEQYARKLIEEPLVKASGDKHLFVGNAVNRILFYSASSAYYVRWILNNVIKNVKVHRLSKITEADVEFAIRNNFCQDLTTDIFDPLTYSGQHPEESDYNEKDNIAVLEKIANIEIENPDTGCKKAEIVPSENDNNGILTDIIKRGDLDNILKNLTDRGVLIENHQYYKIKVKLYLLWVMRKKYWNLF